MSSRAAVPNILAPGTGFVEDNFSTEGGGRGIVQAVMRAMGSDGEQHVKLCSLTLHSPPAVPPGS